MATTPRKPATDRPPQLPILFALYSYSKPAQLTQASPYSGVMLGGLSPYRPQRRTQWNRLTLDQAPFFGLGIRQAPMIEIGAAVDCLDCFLGPDYGAMECRRA